MLQGNSTHYTATGLEDIAKFLEELAQRQVNMQAPQNCSTRRARDQHRGQEIAYRDAAMVVRQTRIDLTPSMRVAMEFGFKCHEKGMNLQATQEEFNKTTK